MWDYVVVFFWVRLRFPLHGIVVFSKEMRAVMMNGSLALNHISVSVSDHVMGGRTAVGILRFHKRPPLFH